MGFASLFITHDFSVVKYISDRIAVMYLGNIVEVTDPEMVWHEARHPYTRGLISAVPVADPEFAAERKKELLTGETPSQSSPPTGCRFHPRCVYAIEMCSTQVPLLLPQKSSDERLSQVACHLAIMQ